MKYKLHKIGKNYKNELFFKMLLLLSKVPFISKYISELKDILESHKGTIYTKSVDLKVLNVTISDIVRDEDLDDFSSKLTKYLLSKNINGHSIGKNIETIEKIKTDWTFGATGSFDVGLSDFHINFHKGTGDFIIISFTSILNENIIGDIFSDVDKTTYFGKLNGIKFLWKRGYPSISKHPYYYYKLLLKLFENYIINNYIKESNKFLQGIFYNNNWYPAVTINYGIENLKNYTTTNKKFNKANKIKGILMKIGLKKNKLKMDNIRIINNDFLRNFGFDFDIQNNDYFYTNKNEEGFLNIQGFLWNYEKNVGDNFYYRNLENHFRYTYYNTLGEYLKKVNKELETIFNKSVKLKSSGVLIKNKLKMDKIIIDIDRLKKQLDLSFDKDWLNDDMVNTKIEFNLKLFESNKKICNNSFKYYLDLIIQQKVISYSWWILFLTIIILILTYIGVLITSNNF